MAVAERAGDRIVFDTEYRERQQVGLIPGIKWDAGIEAWWCPLSWAACVQARGVFGSELAIGPELNAWARAEIESRIQPCLALRDADDAPDFAIMTALHPFQRAGAKFLSTARQALLADEMGLGKSIQTIAAMEAIGNAAYPALVVCPNSMRYTWAEEFRKWAPAREVVVLADTAAPRKKQIDALVAGEAEVAVVNYEKLRTLTRLAGYGSINLTDKEKTPGPLNDVVFKTVVADEAHRAKDPKAKQTRALWFMGYQAENRFALTGTPVANGPEDLWSLMRFIAPHEFPAKTKFIERYALQSWNVFGFMQVIGIREELKDELFKIVDPRMMRRVKQQVLPQLPPKIYTTRTVTMTAKQKTAYEAIRKEMVAELESGTLLTTNPLTKMTRLLQFASCSGDMGEPAFGVKVNGQLINAPTHPTREQAESWATQTYAGHEIEVVDQTPLILSEPSCKADALEEIIAETGDQQIVVFMESRQLLDICSARLVKAGYNIGAIHGGVSALDRATVVNEFQAGKLKAILLTLGAGGEGLTLTAAHTSVFLQRSFSLIKNSQAEDRIYGRMNDLHGAEIIDVITEGTIEQRVHAILMDKEARLEEIVRDQETLKRWLAK